MTKPGGRPPHEPTADTRKNVEALASFGVPQPEIAKVIGISEKTLRKHYADVLETAAIKANSLVAQALFKKATQKDGGQPAVTAAIFWLKTRAGWKETSVQELTGPNGGPIKTEETGQIDLKKMTKDDRASLRAIIQRARPAGGPGEAPPGA